MNLQQLRQSVFSITGRTDEVALTDEGINFGLEDASARHMWSELLTENEVILSEGELSVNLSPDLDRVLEVRAIDGRSSVSLEISTKPVITSRYPHVDSDPGGRPEKAYLEGKTLFIVPKANKDYPIRYSYFRVHPKLENNGDSLVVKTISEPITSYAASHVFRAVEAFDSAQQWYQQYERSLLSRIKLDRDNLAVVLRARYEESERRGPHGEFWLDPFVKRTP